MMIKRCMLAVVAALAGIGQTAQAQATQVLVPAYFYPSWDKDQSYWDEMQALVKSGVQVTAIMNVSSGHATAANSDYATAVKAFHDAGGHLFAYVATCYGIDNCYKKTPAHQPPSAVLQEVENYDVWYPGIVEGVFLDEMSSQTAPAVLDYYREVTTTLRARHPAWKIVGNAGAAVPRDYLDLVDTVVTFEGSEKMYRDLTALQLPEWAASEAPSRQAHLIYNAYTAGAMRELVSLARSRNAGYLYITDEHHNPAPDDEMNPYYEPNPADHADDGDDNPWNDLPSYWSQLIAALGGSEPGSAQSSR